MAVVTRFHSTVVQVCDPVLIFAREATAERKRCPGCYGSLIQCLYRVAGSAKRNAIGVEIEAIAGKYVDRAGRKVCSGACLSI